MNDLTFKWLTLTIIITDILVYYKFKEGNDS